VLAAAALRDECDHGKPVQRRENSDLLTWAAHELSGFGPPPEPNADQIDHLRSSHPKKRTGIGPHLVEANLIDFDQFHAPCQEV
jgi:hypothetical protein